jgi:SPP1 gp7 family putative phage head morphogenesis protein
MPGRSYNYLKNKLAVLYAIHSAEEFPSLLSDEELKKLIDDLIEKIFNDENIKKVNRELKQYFVDQLWQAVQEGYGKKIEDVKEGTDDYITLNKLLKDTINFSSAKTKAMNDAIFNELKDDKGQIRSFNDFKQFVYPIAIDFTGAWLKSEYNFAVASSQMAEKWQRFESRKEAIPFLQYETVGDDRVRPAHRELEGVVKEVDDPFWDLYYPPNGWNCRCTVRGLADATVTPDEKINYPEEMPDLFKINFGKLKKVFPPDHPYYGE